MKSRLLLLALFLLLPALRHDARAQNSPNMPTAMQFDFAYHILKSADDAREANQIPTALVLYEEAAKEYARVMREFPDWDRGQSLYRSNYAVQELERLRELQVPDSGRTPEGPATTPVVAAPTTNATPANMASPAAPRLSIDTAKATARKLLMEGQADEAKDLLIEGLRAEPDNSVMRLLVATAQCQVGNYADAVFVLEQLLEDVPDDAQIRIVLGTAYFGMGATGLAKKELEQALALDPESVEAHYNLARLYSSIEPRNMKAARNHYIQALSLGAERDAELDDLLNVAPQEAAPDQ